MTFEIILEIEPSRNPAKISRLAIEILNLPCSVKVTVPDAPLGVPKALGLAIASYLERIGVQAIAHIRLRDMNRLLFEQLVWSLPYLFVRRVLFLRGDPPSVGKDVDEVDSVTAVRYVKSFERLRYVRVGLYMSLRYPPERVLDRARRAQADFYFLNHYNPEVREHRTLTKELKSLNARVYAYLILAPQEQIAVISGKLGSGQKVYPLEEMESYVQMYRDAGLDGVVLSSPGNTGTLIKSVKNLCNGL